MIDDGFLYEGERNFDPLAHKAVPRSVNLDDLEIMEFGRIDVTECGDIYECFLVKGEAKRLIVFLSAAGRTGGKTSFDRISWSAKLNAYCLYIEDPMYKRHPGLSVAWYYGDVYNSYMNGVSRIAQIVADENGIAREDIIFLGSSAAGYAALYCADKVSGCLAIAMNPQIRPEKWPGAAGFQRITGLDLSKSDNLGRNNIQSIADNQKSRFLIFCNLASRQDYWMQMHDWIKLSPDEIRPSVVDRKSVKFLFHNTPTISPHHVFGGPFDIALALEALRTGWSKANSFMHAIISTLTHREMLAEKVRTSAFHSRILASRYDNRIECDKDVTGRSIKFNIKKLPKGWLYEVKPLAHSSCHIQLHVRIEGVGKLGDLQCILERVSSQIGGYS